MISCSENEPIKEPTLKTEYQSIIPEGTLVYTLKSSGVQLEAKLKNCLQTSNGKTAYGSTTHYRLRGKHEIVSWEFLNTPVYSETIIFQYTDNDKKEHNFIFPHKKYGIIHDDHQIKIEYLKNKS